MTTPRISGDDPTCYIERSKVREILVGSHIDNESTNEVLQEVDALPIFHASDFAAALPPESKGGMVKPTLMDPISSEHRISSIRALTKIGAECHRSKWEFDLSEDYSPSKAYARELITKAFGALHRIGDLAIKERAALQNSPAEPVASDDASKLVFPESPSNSGSAGE